ncbi:hypothetical protein KEM54_006190, partial [Ascosphaera aggregata]
AELNAPQDVITCAKGGVPQKGYPGTFLHCIPMTPSEFGLVSSSYTLGGFIGALIAGPVSTHYGRLATLRSTTFFFFFGPIIETVSNTVGSFVLGRFISGLGAGAAIVVGPIFVAEVAPPHLRGFFGAFTQIGACVGILITQTIGLFLSQGILWRGILAACALIAAVESLCLLFVPESPIWLADHGRITMARAVLQRIRGRDADIETEVASWDIPGREGTEEESLLSPSPPPLSAIAGASSGKKPDVAMLEAVRDPRYRPAVIAVLLVFTGQQFCGINSIIMYSVSLLSPIFPTGASLLVLIVSIINLAVTVICAPLSDKIGRKACVLYSLAGCVFSSILLAIGISLDISIFGAVGVLLFVASFAMGIGPVPFILASELVGPEAVGAAQSWATGANWVATFCIAQFFPLVNEALGGQGKVYYLFAGLGTAFWISIRMFVPETKGKNGMAEVWGRQDDHFD